MPRALVIPTIFKAIDKLSAPVRKMARTTRTFAAKAETAFARVSRAERRLRKGLSKKMGMFGMALGFAMLMRVVGSTIGVFMDFEQANASLAAVMNVTVKENRVLAEDAKRLGATTAKTASEVVGLQEAFARLGFERQAILDMTESTISGSVAMKAELSDTAELVGAMVKTFDDFSSVDAPDIIDKLTKSTQKSALNFEKLQTSLPIVSGAANAAGIPFTKLLALLGKLSDAGIDASSSSTALRNIFLESAKQGLSYEKILEKIAKNQHKLTMANDEFGKRGAVSGVILAQNLAGIEDLDLALQHAGGTAKIAADKQLKTLSGRLTILKSAWQGFILSLEDGNGKFAGFLNTTIEVATEVLSLASGTEKAGSELDDAGKKIRRIAKKVMFFIKVLKCVAIAFAAVKTALFAYNLVMNAYAVVTGVVTAAQWLLNIALSANPIGLIIIAVAALIPLMIAMVKHWDTWGQHLGFIAGGPILVILDLVKFIGTEWASIKTAFTDGGIIGGIKRIGQTIFRMILKPLEHVIGLLEKIGVVEKGTFARMLEDVGLGSTSQEGISQPGSNLNADASLETVKTMREEKNITNKATLEILNRAGVDTNLISGDNSIKVTNTLGWDN